MTRQDRALLDRIRDTLREVEPGAQVILYGSRARGDAKPDSDWDLLILVDGSVDVQRTAAVQRRLYQLELETDTVLSSIVHSKETWASPLYRAMPFHDNVIREGIDLDESTGGFLSRDDPPGRRVAWREKTMTPVLDKAFRRAQPLQPPVRQDGRGGQRVGRSL